MRFLTLPIVLSALISGCSDNASQVESANRGEEQLEVVMFQVTPAGTGPTIGKVFIQPAGDDEVTKGVRLQPALHDLSPGKHGFHVHENPSCEPGEKGGQSVAALAAGGHYDPNSTGHHEGPEGDGHLGDLPVLEVDENGKAVSPVEAPRLSLSELKGRSLVIHDGADNYSDNPPLGGGGARIACGIIQ
ncbi:superoxide dismutase [Cu-Zn] SodC [Endozoicomonas sp. SCSIO W0465]|nr:superoxide dismutase [Cu-Zn] SodC [Endozoicomonas sp. SCSIO W0465]